MCHQETLAAMSMSYADTTESVLCDWQEI